MNNNCKKKRSILNLFEIYTCDNCSNFLSDEWFYIGRNIVNICHIGKGNCKYINEDFINENKIKQIILEYYKNQNEALLLWIDSFFIEDYFDLLDKLIDEYNIVIITK